MMVEAGAKEATEEEMVGALDAAHQAIKRIAAAIEELKAAVGKAKKTVAAKEIHHEFYREVEERAYTPLAEAMRIKDKLENYERVDEVLDALVASIPEEEVQRRSDAKHIFKELKEKVLRDEVLEKRVRLDGRKFDEIRPIWSEVGVLPRVHGSAVFTRGETQALVTVTLGTSDDQQKIETVEGEVYRRFMCPFTDAASTVPRSAVSSIPPLATITLTCPAMPSALIVPLVAVTSRRASAGTTSL